MGAHRELVSVMITPYANYKYMLRLTHLPTGEVVRYQETYRDDYRSVREARVILLRILSARLKYADLEQHPLPLVRTYDLIDGVVTDLDGTEHQAPWSSKLQRLDDEECCLWLPAEPALDNE